MQYANYGPGRESGIYSEVEQGKSKTFFWCAAATTLLANFWGSLIEKLAFNCTSHDDCIRGYTYIFYNKWLKM